jgi:hypothetical protein
LNTGFCPSKFLVPWLAIINIPNRLYCLSGAFLEYFVLANIWTGPVAPKPILRDLSLPTRIKWDGFYECPARVWLEKTDKARGLGGAGWLFLGFLTESYMQFPSLAVSALRLPGPFPPTATKTIYLILLKRV